MKFAAQAAQAHVSRKSKLSITKLSRVVRFGFKFAEEQLRI